MDNHRPLHEIARLVTLYRDRTIKPYQWDAVGDAYDRAAIELNRARHRLLRAAHSVGRELRGHIPAVDELAASTVAYVLLDDGQASSVVGRFMIPGFGGEQLDDGDPRHAMRKALAAIPPGSAPQRTIGIMLNGWGLWVTGSTARVITWTEDRPIPRVAGWPTFAIPTPAERPQ